MKRTTLLGSVTAGLMAAAVSSPVWAQATTYPDGTDCSAIQNSASRTECMNQMDESRQNPASGQTGDPTTNTDVAPGAADENVPSGTLNAPSATQGGTDSPANNPNGAGTGTGTGTGGATGGATQ